MSEFKVGDKVRLISNVPIYGFGNAKIGDVGTIIFINDYEIKIGFGNYVGQYYDKVALELVKEEPKVIKAYDLMKLAAENPEKYEGKRYKANLMLINGSGKSVCEAIVKNGRLCAGSIPAMRLYITEDTQLEEIKPEPKPVNVLDAMQARFDNDKTLRCVLGGAERIYKCNLTGLEDQNRKPVSANEILNGTWYIEE